MRRGLLALLLAVPLVTTGGTAQAAACSGTSGVTVVVQFTSGTVTGCAPGNPTSGTQALTSAGFSVSYVSGQAFVCKINSQPAGTSCARTPPASAYWAYFHAKRGGTWSYSSEGATTYDPAPGSVEGWRFGNGAKPGTAPPAAAATPKPKPKPAPKPAPAPTTNPSPAGKPPTASAGPSAKGTVAARAARTKAAKAAKAARTEAAKARARKTAAAKANVSASATPTSRPSGTAASLDKTGPGPDGGSGNVPWLWGLVGLVVVGGAAGAVTLARRH